MDGEEDSIQDLVQRFDKLGTDHHHQELRRRRHDAFSKHRMLRKSAELDRLRNIDIDMTQMEMESENDEMETVVEARARESEESLKNVRTRVIAGVRIVSNSLELSPMDNASRSYRYPTVIDERMLTVIKRYLYSGIERRHFIGCQLARKFFIGRDPTPINQIVQSGIVPKFIQLLSSSNFETQLESACVINHIALGNSYHTKYLIDKGVVGPLIGMLRCSFPRLVMKASLILGNLASDSPNHHDFLINITKEILPSLIELSATYGSSLAFLRTIMWAITSICRSQRSLLPDTARAQVLPVLVRMILLEDMEILLEVCWALAYLSEGSTKQIQDIIAAGVIPRVVQLLGSDSSSKPGEHNIVTPCLWTIGNILSGSDSQTDYLLGVGPIIQILGRLIRDSGPAIGRRAIWALSNIASGTVMQINDIIQSDIVKFLISTILQGGEFECQKEVVWCIANIINCGTMEQVLSICEQGALSALCRMLSCKDAKTVFNILSALDVVLKRAAELDKLEAAETLIDECGGLEAIKILSRDKIDEIRMKAVDLTNSYFKNKVNNKTSRKNFDLRG